MNWKEVRAAYPDRWLIIEAIEAHSEKNMRMLDRISVIESCNDGSEAMKVYRMKQKQYPGGEFYFVHTSRDTLAIEERRWAGVRGKHEAVTG